MKLLLKASPPSWRSAVLTVLNARKSSTSSLTPTVEVHQSASSVHEQHVGSVRLHLDDQHSSFKRSSCPTLMTLHACEAVTSFFRRSLRRGALGAVLTTRRIGRRCTLVTAGSSFCTSESQAAVVLLTGSVGPGVARPREHQRS